jgi:hypothetical protein
MEIKNYKLIENRPELTQEQVMLGINFGAIKKNISISKKHSFNNLFISVLTVCVIIILGIIIYDKRTKPNSQTDKKMISDTTTEKILPPKLTEEIISVEMQQRKEQKKLDTTKNILKSDSEARKVEIENEEMEAPNDIKPIKAVPFIERSNADAQYAIAIKDSIYGPTNVSRGYGDLREYEDKSNPKNKETNSAWFKFTIKRDTLLTFHIVPTLATDNFDFVLFKGTNNYDFFKDLRLDKIKPERISFSWNSTVNKNTGLSNSAKDTTFDLEAFYGGKSGKTYAPGLKVKAGETYYLMITNSMSVQKQDPDGFMIYFYSYLPRNKKNLYKDARNPNLYK